MKLVIYFCVRLDVILQISNHLVALDIVHALSRQHNGICNHRQSTKANANNAHALYAIQKGLLNARHLGRVQPHLQHRPQVGKDGENKPENDNNGPNIAVRFKQTNDGHDGRGVKSKQNEFNAQFFEAHATAELVEGDERANHEDPRNFKEDHDAKTLNVPFYVPIVGPAFLEGDHCLTSASE